MTDKPVFPRVLILCIAMTGGVMVAISVQLAMARFGLDLAAVWRELGVSRTAQLRSAIAWWLIAGASFAAGLIIAAAVKFLAAHADRVAGLWLLPAAAIVAALMLAGREAAAPAGLSPAGSVMLGLALLMLAGLASLLGAYFVARR